MLKSLLKLLKLLSTHNHIRHQVSLLGALSLILHLEEKPMFFFIYNIILKQYIFI